jgi:uncharacterized protein YkwD
MGAFALMGKNNAAPRAMRVRRSSALTVLVLCTGLLIANAPAAHAVTTSEQKMANYINQTRVNAGRHALRLSSSVSDLARKHSYKMAQAGTIFHTSNLGYSLRNYSWSVAGENVGVGPSMYRLHRAFMNSAPHRSNILYRGFERMGIGVIWKDGMAYITVMFLDYA